MIDLRFNGWGLRELRLGDKAQIRQIELIVPEDRRPDLVGDRRGPMTLLFSAGQFEDLMSFVGLLLAAKKELKGLNV